jgi:hypothetical protein
MWFIHALDAMFELMAVVRKLLSHFIDAAWNVATKRGPDGDDLADFELVGGHRFLDLGRGGIELKRGKAILLRDHSHDRFQTLVLLLPRGVDAQIDHYLDLVTAIVARPEMTDFVLGRIC